MDAFEKRIYNKFFYFSMNRKKQSEEETHEEVWTWGGKPLSTLSNFSFSYF
jgi:hypothetical protein